MSTSKTNIAHRESQQWRLSSFLRLSMLAVATAFFVRLKIVAMYCWTVCVSAFRLLLVITAFRNVLLWSAEDTWQGRPAAGGWCRLQQGTAHRSPSRIWKEQETDVKFKFWWHISHYSSNQRVQAKTRISRILNDKTLKRFQTFQKKKGSNNKSVWITDEIQFLC